MKLLFIVFLLPTVSFASGRDSRATQSPSCNGHMHRTDKAGHNKAVELVIPCRPATSPERKSR